MSGRRNLAVAHAGYMTWDPPEVRCRGCECRFDSWRAFGEHMDRLLSAPPRSRAQAVKDVLADHLGDFGSEGVLEPCINAHGRIVCGCGWMTKGPDIMDEYALILRRRANIEHIDLGEQPVTGILRDTRPNKENQ